MPNKYYLVESGALEHLLRTHFLLTQSLLLFEHLLSHSDRQLRRYCVSGQLAGFHFGRRLMFSAAEINRFVERTDTECRQRKELKNRIRNL